MRFIKRAVCVLIIIALALSVVPTTVSASALSVVGTSFSSAGLTSAEFVASAGPYAIGILAAVAAAFGIKAYVRSQTGQDTKNYYYDLIKERAVATRRSEAEVIEELLSNATIGEQGNIVLGRLSYAEAKEILLSADIAVTRPSETLQLGGFVFSNSRDYVYRSDDDPEGYIYYLGADTAYENNMFFQTSTSGGYLCFVTVSGISNNVNGYITSKNLVTGHLGEYYPSNWYRVHNINIGNRIMTIRMFGYQGSRYNIYAPVYNINDILNQDYTADDLVINSPTDTLYGVDETLRDQNVGLYDGLVLAPDLINAAVLGGAAGEITASDYCGALVDYVSGYDTVIDGVTVTGLPEAATVSRSIDVAPTSDTVVDEAPLVR